MESESQDSEPDCMLAPIALVSSVTIWTAVDKSDSLVPLLFWLKKTSLFVVFLEKTFLNQLSVEVCHSWHVAAAA